MMRPYPHHACARQYTGQRGFSLVELMVVMVIVLVMSLAIFSVISSSEGQKRTTTTTNDANQAGNYAMYQLDKVVRAAGSGYGNLWQTAYGCQINATLTNSNSSPGQILPFPSSSTMAAPFASLNSTVSGSYVLAPALIAYHATTGTTDTTTGSPTAQPSDALITMSGTDGFGEFPILFTAATATSITLSTYSTVKPNDLLLVVNDTANNKASPCMLEQVASTFSSSPSPTSAALSGAYAGSPIGTVSLTANISSVSAVVDLGNANPTNGDMPMFQLIGVGPGVGSTSTNTGSNALYSYDLLQGGTSGATFNTSAPMADSVFEMHALYYVSSATSTTNYSWQSPQSSPYDIATLESGTTAAQQTISTIKAIRIGLIMRSAIAEKTAVTTGTLSLFSDIGSPFTYTRTFVGSEQNYRYRTIEATIPIRNAMLLTSE